MESSGRPEEAGWRPPSALPATQNLTLIAHISSPAPLWFMSQHRRNNPLVRMCHPWERQRRPREYLNLLTHGIADSHGPLSAQVNQEPRPSRQNKWTKEPLRSSLVTQWQQTKRWRSGVSGHAPPKWAQHGSGGRKTSGWLPSSPPCGWGTAS